MKALITGSAGFVGSHLLPALVSAGHEVVSSDRKTGGPDLTDRQGIQDYIASVTPDVIFHLGGQSHVPTSWEDPIGTLRANVEGTQNVLDAAHLAGVNRTLVVTSAEVYGQVDSANLPITEEHPLRPVNPYAASKVAADAVALQAFLGRGQDVIRLRAFNHIGPGQSSSFAAAGLAARIAAAEQAATSALDVGNMTSRRDFTDVRDVVRAYIDIAEAGIAGEAYNVCSGKDVSIQEIADGLLAHSPLHIALHEKPELMRPVDVPVVRGDFSKIREQTGWSPMISLDDSLLAVLDDARSRVL